jgi:hypothetical protein
MVMGVDVNDLSMWVDALVPGPAMICGITEASATRKR